MARGTWQSMGSWKSWTWCSAWAHTGSAQLNTVENSFQQRPCFWVRKFNSKGNFKDFLEESLVFVGGHCASDRFCMSSGWPGMPLCPQGHCLHMSELSPSVTLFSLEVSSYLHSEWGRYERKGGKEGFPWRQAYWTSHSAHILAGTILRVSLTPPLAL